MVITGIILMAAGIFTALGGIFNWDRFMGSSQAQVIVKVFKRSGARIFYILLGAILIAAGVISLI